MNKYQHDEFEIYGFEGTVLIECEMILPVLRHKATDRFLKGSVDEHAGEAYAFFTRKEIERLAAERELTLLPKARPCVPRARVLYVTADFLQILDAQLPPGVDWQELEPRVWVTCGSEPDLRALMNEWADRLILGSTDSLVHFLESHEEHLREEAERQAELALCATTDASLRASTYFRYGVAIAESNRPERLQHFFAMFIQPEFTNWTLETFLEDLHRFKHTLRIRDKVSVKRTKLDTAAGKASATSTPLNIAEVKGTVEEILKEVWRVSQIKAPQERIAAAFVAAEVYRNLFSVSDESVNRVAQRIISNEVIRLKDGEEALQVCAGEPAFYYARSYSTLGDSMVVKGMEFIKAAEDFISQTIDAQRRGPIVDWIIKKIYDAATSGTAARTSGQRIGRSYVQWRATPPQSH